MQNIKSFCLVFMFLVLFGARDISLAASGPVLKEVRLSGPGSDAQHVEIIADTPLTYTYYRMPDLLKVVIDLALVEPGPVSTVLAGSGLISKVTVDKKEVTTFSLTRVVIDLKSDVDFAVYPDAGDRSRLLVTLKTKGSQVTANALGAVGAKAASGVAEPATMDVAAPAGSIPARESLPATTDLHLPETQPSPHPKAMPAAPLPSATTPTHAAPAQAKPSKPALVPVVPAINPSRTINAIRINKDNIQITASSRLDDFKAFTLISPARLVIDIPMGKTSLAAKEISLKRFGISKARVGNYPDKVRMVFDADGSNFPSYRIDRNEKGLTVVFPGKTGKSSQ